MPALIKKVSDLKYKKNKILKIWGSGKVKRELIYVDDLADACIHFMNIKTKHSLINIGSGVDYSIKKYAEMFLKVLVPRKKIKIEYDLSKPNGTPRKVLDVSLARQYGWKAKINFKKEILETYKSFITKK